MKAFLQLARLLSVSVVILSLCGYEASAQQVAPSVSAMGELPPEQVERAFREYVEGWEGRQTAVSIQVDETTDRRVLRLHRIDTDRITRVGDDLYVLRTVFLDDRETPHHMNFLVNVGPERPVEVVSMTLDTDEGAVAYEFDQSQGVWVRRSPEAPARQDELESVVPRRRSTARTETGAASDIGVEERTGPLHQRSGTDQIGVEESTGPLHQRRGTSEIGRHEQTGPSFQDRGSSQIGVREDAGEATIPPGRSPDPNLPGVPPTGGKPGSPGSPTPGGAQGGGGGSPGDAGGGGVSQGGSGATPGSGGFSFGTSQSRMVPPGEELRPTSPGFGVPPGTPHGEPPDTTPELGRSTNELLGGDAELVEPDGPRNDRIGTSIGTRPPVTLNKERGQRPPLLTLKCCPECS
jgi:hypothetical protein